MKDAELREALLRARNHIGTARWELQRVHEMNADEPCNIYEVWTELGEMLDHLTATYEALLPAGYEPADD